MPSAEIVVGGSSYWFGSANDEAAFMGPKKVGQDFTRALPAILQEVFRRGDHDPDVLKSVHVRQVSDYASYHPSPGHHLVYIKVILPWRDGYYWRTEQLYAGLLRGLSRSFVFIQRDAWRREQDRIDNALPEEVKHDRRNSNPIDASLPHFELDIEYKHGIGTHWASQAMTGVDNRPLPQRGESVFEVDDALFERITT